MKSDWKSVELYHRISFGWCVGDLERRIPGGENGVEVLGRFDNVIEEVAETATDGSAVAVVAHGQMIRVWAAARAHNVDVDFAARHSLHNTGVVALEGSPDLGWTALSWTGIAIGGARLDEGAATGPGGEASGEAS
jgi:probable phosphoglycerate mutase